MAEAVEKEPISLVEVQTEIENQLSCALCLERFTQPKALVCNHIYCKSCIDQLLRFRPDGSATISCPLKCDLETTIECTKTTNDLTTNFYIQGIIDKISERYPTEKNLKRQCGESGCAKMAAAFCCACDILLCNGCRSRHGILHAESFVPVTHNRDDHSLLVVCEEHNTEANFVCFESCCNSKFLCLYCIERDHKTHYKETIGVKSERIKQWLKSEKEMAADTDASIREINNMKLRDEESVCKGRQSLERLLKKRTIDEISACLKRMECAATRLLNEFDIAVDIHEKSYPDTNIDEFYSRFDDADDALVALMEKNAVKYLAKLSSAKVSLPTVNVTLADGTGSNPLGVLSSHAGPHKSINDQCQEANFRFDDGCGDDDCDDKSFRVADLWEGVEKLIGEKRSDSAVPEPSSKEKEIEEVSETKSSLPERLPDSNNSEPVKIKVHKSVQTTGQLEQNAPLDEVKFNPVVLIQYGFKFILGISIFIGILSFIISGLIVSYGSYYYLPSILNIGTKVDGGYTQWTKFSSCTVTCGSGVRSRERFCSNPEPRNGGRSCSELGPDKETEKCSRTPCAIDGGYSGWGNFGPCSQSCGKGLRTRERYCSNPSPRKGGKSCSLIGSSLETEQCNLRPCPVDGGYSEWGEFGSCSKTCGKGLRQRERFCTNPSPQHGGSDCFRLGANVESENCSLNFCPVDGGYTDWGNFGPCSRSCGKGLRTRERYCSNPKPKNGGRPCSVIGPSLETEQCNTDPCPPPTFDFHFITRITETVERSYPEYNAEFVGFGIGVNENGKDAYQGRLRKRVSSLPKCLKFCSKQKKFDPTINGAQYEMYGIEVCFCEHGFVKHKIRNDHLHYKLL